jgi:hypothetical protein
MSAWIGDPHGRRLHLSARPLLIVLIAISGNARRFKPEEDPMTRIRSKHHAGVLAVVLVGLTLVPSTAGAFGRIFAFPPGGPPFAFVAGIQFLPPDPAGPFPGTPALIGPAPAFFASVAPGPPPAPHFAVLFAGLPAPGVAGIGAFVVGLGAAGLASKLPSIAAATPDTLHDSLMVSVNRSTPGQVTISISGFAQHLNPATALTVEVSRLRVNVYADTTSAKNGFGEISYGEMKFSGSATRAFSGFFNPGDFTVPTTIGDGNDYQVATVPSLQKVVSVPNANTACVEAMVNPDAVGPEPASTPFTLALLATLLLGGATGFLVVRRRSSLA